MKKFLFTIILLSILNQTFAQNDEVNNDSVSISILNAQIVTRKNLRKTKKKTDPYVYYRRQMMVSKEDVTTFKVTLQNNSLNDTICEIHYEIKFRNRKGELLGIYNGSWWSTDVDTMKFNLRLFRDPKFLTFQSMSDKKITKNILAGFSKAGIAKLYRQKNFIVFEHESLQPLKPEEKITYYSYASKSEFRECGSLRRLKNTQYISIEITSVVTTEYKRFLEKEKIEKENEKARLAQLQNEKNNWFQKREKELQKSSEALKELKLAKEKLDLGLITELEYEMIKKRLRVFIR